MSSLDKFLNFFTFLASKLLNSLKWTGRFTKTTLYSTIYIFRPPYRIKLFFDQMYFIGNGSLPVVILTGAFTGMVMALQMIEVLKRFNAESVVGGIVAVALVRELCPVLTALMVNARSGSAIAAELGTMKVTEQIMALESMAINSHQYLISPRILAGFVMLPVLNVLSNATGIFGGYIISVFLLNLDPGLYIAKISEYLSVNDILNSSLKAAVFGFIVTAIASYQGMNTGGGAKGVGDATTSSVVLSSVLILVFDYIITSFIV